MTYEGDVPRRIASRRISPNTGPRYRSSIDLRVSLTFLRHSD